MSNNDATPRDGEQHELGIELWEYKIGAVSVILFDWAEGADLFTTAGTAETAQEAAEHDGPAIKDGQYRDFVVDEDGSGLIIAYHPQAGRRDTYAPKDQFNNPVTLLSEVDHVQ